jgi:hypothetical protein
VLEKKPHGQLVSSSTKHVPWLVDSLEALNEDEKRWKESRGYNPVGLLKQALDLTFLSFGVEQVVSHKLYAMIVLLSADVAERMDELQIQDEGGNDTAKAFAMALVQLADVSTKQRPISKLVAAQLLKPLDRIFTGGHLSNSSGDLKVRAFPNTLYYEQNLTSSYPSDLYLSYERL